MDDDRILSTFPFLGPPTSEPAQLIRRYGRETTVPGGRFIAREGERCEHMTFLLDGGVRVYKTGGTGREITLYRLEPGESCILTVSSILSDQEFPAHAVTEGEVEALLVPASAFRDWVGRFGAWQRYVFDLLSHRLAAVIEVVNEVSFRRLDARLAAYLAEHGGAAADGTLETTHEKIAGDLGSSREVVSRMLKEFERANLIALSRGHIHIADLAALHDLASH